MAGTGRPGKAEVLAGALATIDGDVGVTHGSLQLEELHKGKNQSDLLYIRYTAGEVCV